MTSLLGRGNHAKRLVWYRSKIFPVNFDFPYKVIFEHDKFVLSPIPSKDLKSLEKNGLLCRVDCYL